MPRTAAGDGNTPDEVSYGAIRAMQLGDIPALAALMRRHDSWIGAYKASPPDNAADAVQRLTRQYVSHQQGHGWFGVVVEGQEVRGQAALVNVAHLEGLLEILVWVDPEFAGRGLGTAAAAQLVAVGFGEMDAAVILGRAHPDNKRSLGMLTAAGFGQLRHEEAERLAAVPQKSMTIWTALARYRDAASATPHC